MKNFSARLAKLKGFTLIELLIVITIIGILIVALLPKVMGAPGKARDTARKSDLNAIAVALEGYMSDKGIYPDADSRNAHATATQCLNDPTTAGSVAQTLIDGGYLSSFPKAPSNYANNSCGLTGCNTYAYGVDSTGLKYMLAVKLEGTSGGNHDTVPNADNCKNADAADPLVLADCTDTSKNCGYQIIER